MKILDRYMFRSLLTPLVSCLVAFTMVFVIFDLFDHLDDFIQGETEVFHVLRFYGWIIPTTMVYISPISMLLAVLYSLTQLTKNNELTAMRACGVSVLRITAPVLALGFLLAAATAAINESLAPDASYRTAKFIRIQRAQDKRLARMAPDLAFRNEARHRSWWIRYFDTETHELHGVQITEMSPEGKDLRKINAEHATWTDGRWWLRQVLIRDYDDFGSLRGVGRKLPSMEMPDLSETPADFMTLVKEPRSLSALELISYRKSHPSMPPDDAARLAVDFHSRLAMPWMTLIVTLLGIPFGNQTARKGALVGIMLALGLFFGFWFCTHVGIWAGKEGLIAPWLAGWGPDILFSTLGVILISRLK